MNDKMQSLPNLLETRDGEKVQTVEQWKQKRRPETLALFRDLVFGRTPVQRPTKYFILGRKGVTCQRN